MESMKSELSLGTSSELSLCEVMGEQGSVLPERSLLRHRRRGSNFLNLGAIASADHGSAANANSNIQIGNNNSNTTTQTATVLNFGF